MTGGPGKQLSVGQRESGEMESKRRPDPLGKDGRKIGKLGNRRGTHQTAVALQAWMMIIHLYIYIFYI
jgi:hypothetical protein